MNIPFPTKKYSILYADPPWNYNDKRTKPGPKGNKAGGAANHYSTMTLQEIKDLPVKDITEKDSILFLWATFPNIQVALDVVAAWGFKYKTIGFNWVKTSKSGRPAIGVGHYTRANAEVCLIGIKGKPKVVDHSISNIIMAPREEHSKKPDAVRDLIVRLVGSLPRIELFARQTAPGWDCWGDEAPITQMIPIEVIEREN